MNPFHKFKNVDKQVIDKSIHAYQQAEQNWNEAQVNFLNYFLCISIFFFF